MERGTGYLVVCSKCVFWPANTVLSDDSPIAKIFSIPHAVEVGLPESGKHPHHKLSFQNDVSGKSA